MWVTYSKSSFIIYITKGVCTSGMWVTYSCLLTFALLVKGCMYIWNVGNIQLTLMVLSVLLRCMYIWNVGNIQPSCYHSRASLGVCTSGMWVTYSETLGRMYTQNVGNIQHAQKNIINTQLIIYNNANY